MNSKACAASAAVCGKAGHEPERSSHYGVSDLPVVGWKHENKQQPLNKRKVPSSRNCSCCVQTVGQPYHLGTLHGI